MTKEQQKASLVRTEKLTQYKENLSNEKEIFEIHIELCKMKIRYYSYLLKDHPTLG